MSKKARIRLIIVGAVVILVAVVYIGQLNVNVKKILNLLEKSHEETGEK